MHVYSVLTGEKLIIFIFPTFHNFVSRVCIYHTQKSLAERDQLPGRVNEHSCLWSEDCRFESVLKSQDRMQLGLMPTEFKG